MKMIVVLAIFIPLTMTFFDNLVRSKYYKDENGNLVFYPDKVDVGYISTLEQIDECAKAFKKCFLFNVQGYKKDIVRIFADCEIVNKRLPANILQKNQAQNMSWVLLISWLLICVSMLAVTYEQKFLFNLMLICSIQPIMILFFKIKYKI